MNMLNKKRLTFALGMCAFIGGLTDTGMAAMKRNKNPIPMSGTEELSTSQQQQESLESLKEKVAELIKKNNDLVDSLEYAYSQIGDANDYTTKAVNLLDKNTKSARKYRNERNQAMEEINRLRGENETLKERVKKLEAQVKGLGIFQQTTGNLFAKVKDVSEVKVQTFNPSNPLNAFDLNNSKDSTEIENQNIRTEIQNEDEMNNNFKAQNEAEQEKTENNNEDNKGNDVELFLEEEEEQDTNMVQDFEEDDLECDNVNDSDKEGIEENIIRDADKINDLTGEEDGNDQNEQMLNEGETNKVNNEGSQIKNDNDLIKTNTDAMDPRNLVLDNEKTVNEPANQGNNEETKESATETNLNVENKQTTTGEENPTNAEESHKTPDATLIASKQTETQNTQENKEPTGNTQTQDELNPTEQPVIQSSGTSGTPGNIQPDNTQQPTEQPTEQPTNIEQQQTETQIQEHNTENKSKDNNH